MELLKSQYRYFPETKLINLPVSAINGMTTAMSTTLVRLNIVSIHDLAKSRFFQSAGELISSESVWGGRSDQVDKASLDDDHVGFIGAPISVLLGISEGTAKQVEEELGIRTLYDMANWPQYQAALEIFERVSAVDNKPNMTGGTPEELVPAARLHASESRYFEQAMIDISLHNYTDTSKPTAGKITRFTGVVTGHERYPVNIGVDVSDFVYETTDDYIPPKLLDVFAPIQEGFTYPALGGLLRFKQDWVPYGLSLGSLLHSIALAPGEATRIAISEWSRRFSGSSSEDVVSDEFLDVETEQRRTLDEVQSNVLQDELDSSDDLSTSANSASDANSAGASVSGGYGPVSASGNISHNNASSNNRSRATRVLNSRGRRDMGSDISQKITSGTKQQSSLARSRRASLVQEVREQESQNITTRVIANYNHMHALTMYYYEVVQLFRTQVAIDEATPLLFIPFKLFDFSQEHIVARYKDVLLRAALNDTDRRLIESATSTISFDVQGPTQILSFEQDAVVTSFSVYHYHERVLANRIILNSGKAIDFSFGDSSLNSDTTVYRLSDIRSVEIEVSNKTRAQAEEAIGFNRISSTVWNSAHISLTLDGVPETVRGIVSLTGSRNQTVVKRRTSYVLGETNSEGSNVRKALQLNRAHYSQVIWRALDRDTLAMLLSNYDIGGVQASEIVDPDIVVTRGNLIGFRLSVGTSDAPVIVDGYGSLYGWWSEWLSRHVEHAKPIEDIVPLPTGGIHGEAVLGRSNCAEKIDLTRFWDWQDSPIPLVPDSIGLKTPGNGAGAAVASGLGQSNLSTVAPQAYPPGSTLGEAIKGLTSGSMLAATADASAITAAAATALNATVEQAKNSSDSASAASAIASAASSALSIANASSSASVAKAEIEANAKVEIAKTGASFTQKLETQRNLLAQTNTRLGGLENRVNSSEKSAVTQVVNVNTGGASSSSSSSTSNRRGGTRVRVNKTSTDNSSSTKTSIFGGFLIGFGNNNTFLNISVKPGGSGGGGKLELNNNRIVFRSGDTNNTDNSNTDNSSTDSSTTIIDHGDTIVLPKENDEPKTYRAPNTHWNFNISFNPVINLPVVTFIDNSSGDTTIVIINGERFALPEDESTDWNLDLKSVNYNKVTFFLRDALESLRKNRKLKQAIRKMDASLAGAIADKIFSDVVNSLSDAMIDTFLDAIKQFGDKSNDPVVKAVARLLLGTGFGTVETQARFYLNDNEYSEGVFKGDALVIGADESYPNGPILRGGKITFNDVMDENDFNDGQDAYHLKFGSLNLSGIGIERLEDLIADLLVKAWSTVPHPLVNALANYGLLDPLAKWLAEIIVAELKAYIGDDISKAIDFSGVEVQTEDMIEKNGERFYSFDSPQASPENSPVVIYQKWNPSKKDVADFISSD